MTLPMALTCSRSTTWQSGSTEGHQLLCIHALVAAVPQFTSSGRPTNFASATAGCAKSAASTMLMFYPPEMSLDLSMIFTYTSCCAAPPGPQTGATLPREHLRRRRRVLVVPSHRCVAPKHHFLENSPVCRHAPPRDTAGSFRCLPGPDPHALLRRQRVPLWLLRVERAQVAPPYAWCAAATGRHADGGRRLRCAVYADFREHKPIRGAEIQVCCGGVTAGPGLPGCGMLAGPGCASGLHTRGGGLIQLGRAGEKERGEV
jgi:hypothetical protein